MTPRKRSILEVLTVSLWILMAAFHFLSGAYRTAWWFITFMHISLPMVFFLLTWSFRRDMRAHLAGTLVVASTKLATEVNVAAVTMFMWIALATYGARSGLPESASFLWVSLAVFLVWLAWVASTIRRARGYAFTLEPGDGPPPRGGVKPDTQPTLALSSFFAWVGFASYFAHTGLPPHAGALIWVTLALFVVWAAWVVRVLSKSRRKLSAGG